MKAITRDNNNDLSENVQGRQDKEGVICPYDLPIFGICISSFSINGIGTSYVPYRAVISGGAEGTLVPPEFRSSANPIPTPEGAYHVHHIIASTPEFENLTTSLPYMLDLSPPKCLSFRRPWKAIQKMQGRRNVNERSLVPPFFCKGAIQKGRRPF